MSERSTRSRAATREFWLDRIARFPHSGLSPAQFCAIEAVSLPPFYSWKRRLAAAATDPVTQPPSSATRGPRLLPIRLPPSESTPELVLAGGIVLRLPPGCDLAWVRSVVSALGDAPC